MKTEQVNDKDNENSHADFLTADELLRRLPVSRGTLHNYCRDGKIPYIKLKSRVLFHWPTVEAALLRRQKEVAA